MWANSPETNYYERRWSKENKVNWFTVMLMHSGSTQPWISVIIHFALLFWRRRKEMYQNVKCKCRANTAIFCSLNPLLWGDLVAVPSAPQALRYFSTLVATNKETVVLPNYQLFASSFGVTTTASMFTKNYLSWKLKYSACRSLIQFRMLTIRLRPQL